MSSGLAVETEPQTVIHLDEGSRRAYLESLPHADVPESYRTEAVGIITASGLPVHNYVGFVYEHHPMPVLGGTEAAARWETEGPPAMLVQTNTLRINTVESRVDI